jgi:hypothetical protein
MEVNRSERGATAIVVAIAMLVILGFAALVIDLGAGFNERAQDQAAADSSVMAAAIDVLGNVEVMRDQALEFARTNLDTAYTDAEWAAMWESCTDPGKASLGLGLTPVPGPAADGNWTGVAQLDCISAGSGGFLHVRIPNQIVAATFGKTIGTDDLEASATATSKVAPRGEGGILPFGLLASATEGDLACLRDNSTGQAKPPCDGSDSGNFGAIESLWTGANPDLATYGIHCKAKPKKDVLQYNIAAGLDHTIVIDQDGAGGSEVQDVCSAPPYFPDTLNTFQGISQGFEQGLVSDVMAVGSSTEEARLWRSPASWEASIFGWDLDNKPLWDFIDAPSAPGDFRDPSDVAFDPTTDLPRSCAGFSPSGYDWDGLGGPDPNQDWDGDGTVDDNESWQHMQSCLQDYVAGGYSTVMLSEDLAMSSRFAYVPQFWESSWPSGNGWRHVMAFRPVFLQMLWFGTGGDKKISIFNPGEACVKADGSSCNYSNGHPGALRQLAAFYIPDGALPEDLRGAGPGGSIDPYEPQLYR